MKKRKDEDRGDLLEVCKEMSSENYVKWKKRKIVEESKWDEIQRIERQNWERTQRKNKRMNNDTKYFAALLLKTDKINTQQEKYPGSVPPGNYRKLYIQKYMTRNRA